MRRTIEDHRRHEMECLEADVTRANERVTDLEWQLESIAHALSKLVDLINGASPSREEIIDAIKSMICDDLSISASEVTDRYLKLRKKLERNQIKTDRDMIDWLDRNE